MHWAEALSGSHVGVRSSNEGNNVALGCNKKIERIKRSHGEVDKRECSDWSFAQGVDADFDEIGDSCCICCWGC